MLLELLLGSVAVFVWSGELCRLLHIEVLVLLRFLWLSSSCRNFFVLKVTGGTVCQVSLGADFRCYVR